MLGFVHVSLVPHWCSEGAVGEPGSDRRHLHAARFPPPTLGWDTPPGGETEVQQRAGEQELPHTLSSSQAQLHRLAWGSEIKFLSP